MKVLEDMKARDRKATSIGQWETTRSNDVVIYDPNGFGAYRRIAHADCAQNAEFIAHARTDLPAVVAALDAILALHVEEGNGNCVVCWDFNNDTDVKWPCPTVAAVASALGEAS